ncbi:unnamed protein product [Candidula unifasciata]|uniref:Uncharacterized protein n=1 Tax=Candidula unifasciata TaxID=100452 RepID=A0A8S3ZA22_9EUPU|nr:unnamed protein product [Candidula unifasciata]
MGKPIQSVQILLSIFLWLPVSQADCVYKECFCSSILILCSNKNLQVMPQLNPEVTSSEWDLNFDGNNVSSIPSGSFPANLTFIDLQDSPLSTMDDDVFHESINTLATIYLSNVRFSKFPNAIGRLRALNLLSITNGNITDWNDDAWDNLAQTLNTLDLDNAGVTSWPMWIKNFTKLTELTISHASFSTIPDNALDGVANTLTSLSLDNNRLTIVPKAVSNLKSLQTLSLSENHITNLDWLPHYSKLDSLSINNNYLSNATHVSQALSYFNETLFSLDINYNLLTAIPDFSALSKVNMLDFSHNKIHDPNSGAAATDTSLFDLSYNSLSFCPRILSTLVLVTDIGLSNNNIKALQQSDFHSQVTSIDVSFNLVTELTEASFPDNFGLMYLQLNNNPLTTISPIALQRLPNLYLLNLRHTQLTRLPLALNYLSGLVTLDVSNCTALVCTCMESSLRPLMMRPYPFKVVGDCGQTSVFEFFSVLSPNCPIAGNS